MVEWTGIFQKEKEANDMRNKYSKIKRFVSISLMVTLVVVMLGGCSNKDKNKSVKTVKNFMQAAKDMNYEKAGKYATDEAMASLGWNDMDSETWENVFYSSLGVSEEEAEILKTDKEVDEAVKQLVEKMSRDVIDFNIQKGTFTEKDGKGTVKVTVTRITSDQLGTIFEGIQSDIEEQANTIGEELASEEDSDDAKSDSNDDDEDDEDEDSDDSDKLSEEEMNVEVMSRLIPSIVPKMIEQYDSTEGQNEDWVIEIDTEKNKITGVYESE